LRLRLLKTREPSSLASHLMKALSPAAAGPTRATVVARAIRSFFMSEYVRFTNSLLVEDVTVPLCGDYPDVWGEKKTTRRIQVSLKVDFVECSLRQEAPRQAGVSAPRVKVFEFGALEYARFNTLLRSATDVVAVGEVLAGSRGSDERDRRREGDQELLHDTLFDLR